ncbi:MAG: hypothetical protein FWD33_03735 [Alphaproteobacteria bacterium]|nr:hypothetical protein [Alphaproteobacteria bacterium]
MAIYVTDNLNRFKEAQEKLAGRETMKDLVANYITNIPGIDPAQVNKSIPTKGFKPTTKDLIVICENEQGNVLPKILADTNEFVPVMVDLKLDGQPINSIQSLGLIPNHGALVVSTDVNSLKALDKTPRQFMNSYNIKNLIVNHKGASIVFDLHKTVSYNYGDDESCWCNYESEREIIARVAAKFVLDGYEMSDAVMEYTFADHPEWALAEPAKEISDDQAMQLLEIAQKNNIINKLKEVQNG